MGRKGYYETFRNYVLLAKNEDLEKLPPLLKRLAIVIRERDGAITLSEAAEILNVSAPTLSKLLKEWYGSMPGEMTEAIERAILAKAEQEAREAAREAGQARPAGRSSGGSRSGGPPVAIEMGRSDVEVVEQIIKARLDTKYPIAAKLIRDVKWFTHVVLDAGIVATITAMRFLQPGETLTFDDPDKDVATILAAINRMAREASEAEAARARLRELEEENRDLREKLALAEMERDELRAAIARLEQGVRKAREAIEKLTTMVEALLDIVAAQAQEAPREEVAAYAQEV